MFLHETAKDCQAAALKILEDTLKNANTPPAVTEALCHGIREWTHQPDIPHIRALTAGSLCGPDAVLTTTFHEQVSIGWLHLCLGRISKKWSTAASQYNNPRWTKSQANQWASLVIAGLWRYGKHCGAIEMRYYMVQWQKSKLSNSSRYFRIK